MILDIEMLSPYVGEKRDEFDEYVNEIIGMGGVQKEDGYTCYVKDNIKIAKLVPKDKIVVDVGCSFGLQQVLYQDHKKYIGIQEFKGGLNCEAEFQLRFSPKIFTKNAKIIKGMFKDVYKELGITDNNKDQYFGIANHSLWHDEKANKEDIEIFKRSFPQNYYATDEVNKQIEYNNMAKVKPKAKTTKKVVVSTCDHIWITNRDTEGEVYVCEKCGEESA